MFDTAKDFLLAEDRGVSPVIGVILMVAITVILAAVIATFVMNMGPSEEQAPNAQLEITNQTDYFEVSHGGGDPVDMGNIDVKVDGNSSDKVDDLFDEMTGGDSFTVDGSGSSNSTHLGDLDNPENSSSLQIIWENPNNDQTQVLREFEG